MRFLGTFLTLLLGGQLALIGPASAQQRISIPTAQVLPSTPAAPAPTGALVPSGAPSGATLLAPNFDPYSLSSGAALPPSLVGQAPPAAPYPYAPPPASPWASPFSPVPAAPAAPVYAQPPPGYTLPYANPPAQPFPSYPPVQYPGGNWSGDIGRADPHHPTEPLKLFQNLRLRHTWLSRLDKEEGLGINDTELATTVAFPNFLLTQQPLYVSPGFILHFWDGPAGVAADLPPRAYTGYVDFDYLTSPQHRLGGDLNVRLGLYSDFDAFNTRSFRVSGHGLGTFRLTPEVQLKFGVEYINRNDLKLLPAGGVLWTPNPQVRWDIYFPRPKLAQYLTTIGHAEIWWYVAGEYGGGAWTIERAAGGDDRIDINDLRVMIGTDFLIGHSFKGFFEAGYVFDREIVYVASPQDNFSPPDTFMLRGGFAY